MRIFSRNEKDSWSWTSVIKSTYSFTNEDMFSTWTHGQKRSRSWTSSETTSLTRIITFAFPMPMFEIASNPQIRLSDIKARRFKLVDSI
jgi:hypothetical protein